MTFIDVANIDCLLRTHLWGSYSVWKMGKESSDFPYYYRFISEGRILNPFATWMNLHIHDKVPWCIMMFDDVTLLAAQSRVGVNAH